MAELESGIRDDLNERDRAVRNSFADLNAKVAELDTQVNDATQQVTIGLNDTLGLFQAVPADIEDLKAVELKPIRAAITDFRSQLDGPLVQQRNGISTRFQSLSVRLEEFDTAITNAVIALNETAATKQKQVEDTLNDELEKIVPDLDELARGPLTKLNDKLTELETKGTTLDETARLAELRFESIEMQSTKIVEVQESLGALDQRFNALDDKLEPVEALIGDINDKGSVVTQRIQTAMALSFDELMPRLLLLLDEKLFLMGVSISLVVLAVTLICLIIWVFRVSGRVPKPRAGLRAGSSRPG